MTANVPRSPLPDYRSQADLKTQDQILLQALQDFIISHVALPTDSVHRGQDMNRSLTGAQAIKLIAALREFVSGVVESSSETGWASAVDVDASSGEDDVRGSGEAAEDNSVDLTLTSPIEEDALTPHNQLSTQSSSSSSSSHPEFPSTELIPQLSKAAFHSKVLQHLRTRVFNKMPIRLLSFTNTITLLERGAIFEHIALSLQARMNDSDYGPTERRTLRGSRMESEDEAVFRILDQHARYAILSHTWLLDSPEVTYGAWKSGAFDVEGKGYMKLANFCKVAWEAHGLNLGWMDTVCINKDSSSELDESIRSMYNWYKRSELCIIFLAETEVLIDIPRDPWFTRGWTLQELLAPNRLKFYNHHWTVFVDSQLNDKKIDALTDKITEATSMSAHELNNLFLYPISRRMQLAAQRNVTREEDAAYSLMGVFGVSISTAYGEGAEHALYRLLQEILSSHLVGVLDLFNWAGELHSATSKILPIKLQHYLHRNTSTFLNNMRPLEPLTLTHMGIRTPIILMPAVSIADNKVTFNPRGRYGAAVSISCLGQYKDLGVAYHLLDLAANGADGYRSKSDVWHITFAVFNFKQDSSGVYVPARCIAIPILCHEEAGKVTGTGAFDRIPTTEPVVFDILQRNANQEDQSAEDYMVLVDRDIPFSFSWEKLAEHGMQLVFKYL